MRGSPALQQEGNPKRRFTNLSLSQISEGEMGRFGEVNLKEKKHPSWTMIGRWSELRVVRVRHSEFMAMWEEAIVRSGELG